MAPESAEDDPELAALLDAWPRLSAGCVQAMRDAGLPAAWSVDLIPVSDHGLTGSRLTVTPPDAAEPGPPGSYREIRRRLEAAPLPPPSVTGSRCWAASCRCWW